MKTYKILLLFTIVILFVSCSKTRNDKAHTKIIDTITEIKVIKFKNARSVIFPAYYMKKKIRSSILKNFFTPNEQTIKNIESKLPETSSIIYEMFGRDDEWMKYYKINANDMPLYDKQYFGYLTPKKDSIVAIKIFNFESDPLKINEKFEKEIDLMTCGWYNSNTCELAYSIKLKKIGRKFD